MDYSDFDRLPRRTPMLTILDQPSFEGIRDMPTLDRVEHVTRGRLEELRQDEAAVARRSGVDPRIIHSMTHGTPVPIADALRVFETIGIKPERVPAEYLEA